MDIADLYRTYAPSVFRFALYLTGERCEAEDITSETFVRAWTSPEPIKTATVKGYLFTIARNLYLQRLRKRSKHDPFEEDTPDAKASPHEQAEQREEFRAVLERLRKLPEMDRAAVLMRAIDGMPYEEIGRALGISLGAVKMKIHRARVALAGIGGARPRGSDS
jgi:RNA polymerase sigma-70 factor (ECF subfamily)